MTRVMLAAAVALAAQAATSVLAAQEPQPLTSMPIAVSAARVEYFGDAAIIQARGHVQVSMGNGVRVEGDAFSMDLSLHRFLVVGHVRLTTPSGEMDGAAYAAFLPFRREYFVPLDPAADRWTFFNGDYANPSKGRVMPGDAFFLPDLSSQRPYIVADQVTIDPTAYAKFSPATFRLLDGALTTIPLPPYVYNFSQNQHFGINALTGASIDVPYNFAGSASSLDAVHFRYDPQRKSYGSFEHHSVFGAGYAVLSLNPATQPFKQWNLLAYDRSSPASAISLETQLFTYQYGLIRPLDSNGFADVIYTQALRQSSARLELTQAYSSLLAQPALGYYGDPSHPWIPNHPFTAGVEWSGFDQHIGRTGLSYRLTSGLGMQHDVFGIRSTGAKQATSEYVSGAIYTPTYPGPFGTGLNARYQIAHAWLSFPNTIDEQVFTGTISRRLARNLVFIGSTVIDSSSTRDPNATFISPNASTGLAPQPFSTSGLPFVLNEAPGSPGATNRVYGMTFALTPSPDFQFTFGASKSAFSPVQTQFSNAPPRYQLTGDVRTRITRTLFIDVQRGYNFGWSGLWWTPYTFVVSAQ
ncbi:MAG TPA: hypothetical protein VN934_11115 [Candidatus Tumulicola sp.]|nr:hypothetical protein [Candidatus Tumulicola sp.]